MSTPISDILDTIDQVTQNYTIHGYAALVSSLTVPITMVITAYIAFIGWSTLQGWSKFTVGEAVKHVIKIALGLSFATQWGVFSTYIYNVLTNGPDELSAILMQSAGSSSNSANAALQDAFNQGLDIGNQLWHSGSIHSPSYYLIAIVIWLLNYLVSGLALLELVVAKCGLAIILVLAPVFCTCLIWDATRNIFVSWLRYALGFSLVPLFLSAVLLIVDQVLKIGLTDINNALNLHVPTIDSICTFVLGSIASIGLIWKAPHIAAGIAGGMAANGISSALAFSQMADKYSGFKALRGFAARSIANKFGKQNKQGQQNWPSAMRRI